ncbi:MAG: type VI secretion system tip protein TssI/VgrG [Candidatus Thiodiazotropha sp.]
MLILSQPGSAHGKPSFTAGEPPLGKGVLRFQSMTASEQLGRLFECHINLVSDNFNINIPDILGQNVTIRLELPEIYSKRYFNGFVSRFIQVGQVGSLAGYQAIVRPWLWFLTRTTDCRIFQDKTAPEIIMEIFRENGFTDFEDRLIDEYRIRIYSVQYRETDFDFISRLMEQEGIYYYFKHEMGKHTLILSDSYTAHDTFPGYDLIPYYPPIYEGFRERDHIYDWEISQHIQPVEYTLDDYDFKRPKCELTTNSMIPREHAHALYEFYDFPGDYAEIGDGEKYVKTRIEELQTQYEQLSGAGDARGLSVGFLFTLTGYPRSDQDREYLVTSANHTIEVAGYETKSHPPESVYQCQFTTIDARQSYRSKSKTVKPFVQGPQTAIIVGPAGEEIWTDEHGRVKCQFHWDREGSMDENSSCWIRVSQTHAGKGFGGIDIPRIGEEVIVSFLEGDPDQPIITGRVYNGDNKPPNGLPDKAMVSGLKSNSTPGGGGNNSVMMDDTKGNEALTTHAQYNMSTTVENDQTNTVHNNKTNTVNNTFTETIKSDATIKITEGKLDFDVMAGTAKYHVSGSVTEDFDTSQTTTVTGPITITSSSGAIVVDAATSIRLHTGASTITMDSSGNINIEGVNITINGSTSVTTSGTMISSEATAQNQISGGIVESNGTATNTVKGGVVLLNP